MAAPALFKHACRYYTERDLGVFGCASGVRPADADVRRAADADIRRVWSLFGIRR
jgi:hypothetical protein